MNPNLKKSTVMAAGVRSITGDNRMMTTPIPQDLQLSESITSVYLHNSSHQASAVSNNIKTAPQTKPVKDPNSISLVPFSKLSSHIVRGSPTTTTTTTRVSTTTTTTEPPTSTTTATTTPGKERVFTVT